MRAVHALIWLRRICATGDQHPLCSARRGGAIVVPRRPRARLATSAQAQPIPEGRALLLPQRQAHRRGHLHNEPCGESVAPPLPAPTLFVLRRRRRLLAWDCSSPPLAAVGKRQCGMEVSVCYYPVIR